MIDTDELERVMRRNDCSTVHQLADKAGLGRATIYRAMRGKGFRSDTLSALIALGARPNKLITLT
jgi:DNA-binding phage protein